VSKNELVENGSAANLPDINGKSWEEVFADIDADGDAEISWEEFLDRFAHTVYCTPTIHCTHTGVSGQVCPYCVLYSYYTLYSNCTPTIHCTHTGVSGQVYPTPGSHGDRVRVQVLLVATTVYCTQTTVLLLYSYCTHTVRILLYSYYCTPTVPLLYGYRYPSDNSYWSEIKFEFYATRKSGFYMWKITSVLVTIVPLLTYSSPPLTLLSPTSHPTLR
jgi:hypothetical protein